MLTNLGRRYFIRLTIALGKIAVAMILAGTQSSYAAGDVFASFKDAGEIHSGITIISLDLPSGKYAVFGKINIDQDDANLQPQLVTVTCSLRPGSVLDRNVIRLHPSAIDGSKASDNGSMPFQAAVELHNDTQISMMCTFPAAHSRKLSFRFAKITAIRVDGSICEKPSPAICSEAATEVLAAVQQSGSITAGVPVAKLSVPSGKYAIFAKINIDQDDTTSGAQVLCALRAGSHSDRNVITLQPSGQNRLDNAAIPFQTVAEFRTEDVDPVPPRAPLHDIELICRTTEGESSKLSFRFAKIMAISVKGTICERQSPAICTDLITDLYASFSESGQIVSDEPIVDLKLPPGLYAIFGKINTDQDDTMNWATVVCTLRADPDVDRALSRLQPSGSFAIDNDTVPLQLVEELPAGAPLGALLACKFDAAESSLLSFRSAKITAIRLQGNRCEKPSPANCLSR